MDYLARIFKQLSSTYTALPPRKRVFALTTLVVTVLSLIVLVIWANRIEYKPLYHGLSTEDSGLVISKLKEMKIPYRISSDGGTILVPASSVYEVRMELASNGLPQNSGVGYEIFDKQNIGVTEFVQKINYQRALQGEIVRTINQLSEVKNCRVHLTIPEKSLFVEDQKKPRASVVLKLYPGRRLSETQINGITHLVASSVEGLAMDDVIIVDSHGKLLAGGEKKSAVSGISLNQKQLQEATEKKLENKIETMLAEIVGPESVSARVAVQMDFTRVEQTEENYDPDKVAVRSEQRSSEKSSGKRGVESGVPGVMSNTPDIKNASKKQPSKIVSYNKSDETVNYEISHVVKKIVNPVGSVEKLSVAVMVDGTYKTVKDKDGNEVKQYVPRTDEEIEKYKSLVMKAVGYDRDRGDSVEVINFQFHKAPVQEEGMAVSFLQKIDWQSMITYMITAILFALFFVFGLKPMLSILSKSVEDVEKKHKLSERKMELESEAAEGLPPGVEAGGAVKSGGKETQLVNFAQTNPKLFAQYIKSWIK